MRTHSIREFLGPMPSSVMRLYVWLRSFFYCLRNPSLSVSADSLFCGEGSCLDNNYNRLVKIFFLFSFSEGGPFVTTSIGNW